MFRLARETPPRVGMFEDCGAYLRTVDCPGFDEKNVGDRFVSGSLPVKGEK